VKTPPWTQSIFLEKELKPNGKQNQNVNRAPNWNWRGVLIVFVIAPYGWPPLEVMLTLDGPPNCGVLDTL
jgi:hypothetical protein